MATEKIVEEKIRVRPMEPEDISSVLEIDHKLSGQLRAITYNDPTNEVLGGEMNFSFIAEVGDKCAGFILAGKLARTAKTGDPFIQTVLIQILGVDPAYQRRGVATELVNALVKTCQNENLEMVRIMVRERDNQLHGFFERIDFHRGELIEYTRTVKSE